VRTNPEPALDIIVVETKRRKKRGKYKAKISPLGNLFGRAVVPLSLKPGADRSAAASHGIPDRNRLNFWGEAASTSSEARQSIKYNLLSRYKVVIWGVPCAPVPMLGQAAVVNLTTGIVKTAALGLI
jgi:hypothetical protein